MQWHDHSKLEGTHALLSPSKKSWLNYDEEQMRNYYASTWASTIGTVIHAFAELRIKRRKRLTKSCKDTLDQYMYENGIPEQLIDVNRYFDNLMAYVNDSIGFGMEAEKILYCSDECYGTADAIMYSEKEHTLRIFDLKTGKLPVSMDQLLSYAALFFIEYRHELNIDISKTNVELRIYQLEDVIGYSPDHEEIAHAIDNVLTKNKMLQKIKTVKVVI